MTYGIDFGTSNSSISYRRNGDIALVEVGGNSVVPSLLFLEKGERSSIGDEAARRYAAAIRKWERAENPAGFFRFFQAIKLALKDEDFKGTRIFEKVWSVEKLVALFLAELKGGADSTLGTRSREVVLGRPVVLSENEETEARLASRFKEACLLAGFDSVSLVRESVAAVASLIGETEGCVLVFDFGGGTLDITTAEIAGKNVSVLSSVGADIGGYALNEDIARSRIIGHFGYGSEFRTMSGTLLEVPYYITDQVASFYALPFTDLQKTRAVIKDLAYEAIEKNKLRGMDEFLRRNLGFDLFARIDEAKIRLSSEEEAEVAYAVPPYVSFTERISRSNFETMTSGRVRAAEALIDKALSRAALKESDVTRVVRVGGSSRVPLFVRMLENKFPDRVDEGEVFTSICSGLIPAAELGLTSG